MSLRKKAQAPATVAAWSVSDLSALYTQNRSSLIAQARRILRSDADAAEVVQDAFLKFILAAPELDTADRAMAYLRTTVNPDRRPEADSRGAFVALFVSPRLKCEA